METIRNLLKKKSSVFFPAFYYYYCWLQLSRPSEHRIIYTLLDKKKIITFSISNVNNLPFTVVEHTILTISIRRPEDGTIPIPCALHTVVLPKHTCVKRWRSVNIEREYRYPQLFIGIIFSYLWFVNYCGLTPIVISMWLKQSTIPEKIKWNNIK